MQEGFSALRGANQARRRYGRTDGSAAAAAAAEISPLAGGGQRMSLSKVQNGHGLIEEYAD